MESRTTPPYTGMILALVSCIALAFFGLHPVAAVAVLIVWIGSLFLTSEKPPDTRSKRQKSSLDLETIGALIENAQSPLLITNRNKVSIANHSARRVLGGHVVGQDTRVIFRQPQAVALFSSSRDGSAVVRGLARRRDIWRINRQTIDGDMAIIELTNKTAEADISRAHTDFVANASHELRTPLAAIIGYVETLSDTPDHLGTDTAQKFLDTILREAQRMRNLVSDLMSLSRVEAEKHDEPDETIALAGLIKRAANDAAGSERKDRIALELETELTIRGDTQQLEQLVRNLVDNALKYGGESSPVTVSLEKGIGGHARFAVQDKGEGIPAEHLPHLTRRFYRTDPGRSRASGGTGLGLAIVKHIVERHRGKLDISSTPGEGTKVTVRFPLLQESA
ncbi:sensor histidine kinase [Altererythrobacter lutimaris]|uniref:histidine kinase n=1 Tax=Altererythrobacter lutimaris TaxID=2743979 RepID=A0A850HG97_9SPHN|nr:ATP-binding protein [Altererythrobacter lutimaris]NVE93682.1 two-component sensor histidine kinase [Altererythrobacter lutimaris]